MPWIAKSKIDYPHILTKNEMYIVETSKNDKEKILIKNTEGTILLFRTQNECRNIFYQPYWIDYALDSTM